MAQTRKPEHKSSFEPAFFLLDGERRAALSAVYAFCREVDDIADEPGITDPLVELAKWRDEMDRIFERKDNPAPGLFSRPLSERLAAAARDYGLRKADFVAILDGVTGDVKGVRYRSMADLEVYLDQVAGSVGLICARIFGAGEAADEYAVALGRAAQLTNILRDVFEDARRGRVYIPLEDAVGLGVGENDILAFKESAALTQLLELEARRAAAYYDRARALRPEGLWRELLPARVMGCLYEGLLRKLVRVGLPSQRRIRLNAAQRVWHALRALP